MKAHDYHEHQILSEIGAGRRVSQRDLALSVGIALGLTNLLIRRLVRKGWVRVIRIRPNRVRYLLTPAGIVEKARRSRMVLQESVRFYVSARDRIRESLGDLMRQGGGGRVVFYGTGEIAEITFLCLQETDLKLVGVVDENGAGRRFLGLPVYSHDDVQNGLLGATPFDYLVITTFDDADTTRARIQALGVSLGRAYWL